jgi:hypothetical protein
MSSTNFFYVLAAVKESIPKKCPHKEGYQPTMLRKNTYIEKST